MSFGISIVKNPVFVWDERRECEVIDWNESRGDRILDFDFDGKDFNELQTFLNIKLSLSKRGEDESYVEHEDRLKSAYLKAAKEKGYEMLGHFWFFYDDAIYSPLEVIQLREQCLKAKSEAQNLDLISATDKILSLVAKH